MTDYLRMIWTNFSCMKVWEIGGGYNGESGEYSDGTTFVL